jgi:arginyl-tRNA synthetase
MIQAKKELLGALGEAIRSLGAEVDAAPAFESPKLAAHGDLAVTAAMQLAKPLRKSPRDVAAALIEALRRHPASSRWLESAEIAGPGFINLKLSAAARQAIVRDVLEAGDAFGREPAQGKSVLVEFVSANPTGPLHTGHTRQAALGDAICNLLEAAGWAVTREFYYNDAGVQIANLTASVRARLKGLKPGDAGWPEAAYNGEYIAEVAAGFAARQTVHADDREYTASGNPDDVDGIRQFAVAWLRHEQDLDLTALGVRFDRYFLESSLYTDGRVDDTVRRIVASGKTYEKDGALWLRSTEYGDDKDRVMRKSSPAGDDSASRDGTQYTYFVPDVAYHLVKFERGFAKAVNIQGGDHHGTIARVRAGLQCAGMGVPSGYPDYVLHKMVTVMRDGAEVKISKRSGDYVTLRDLIDWTGRDAVRFFMLSRKADTEFVFDVDLARQQNDENPVFYVQYAHARICSVLQQFTDNGGRAEALGSAKLSRLTAPAEATLMRRLADYPDVVAKAAAAYAPHDIAFYLRDLAGAFHTYYAQERFLVDDAELAQARLALLLATRQVLRNALGLLGVSAPQRMDKEVSAVEILN